jgi:hypothetical protein
MDSFDPESGFVDGSKYLKFASSLLIITALGSPCLNRAISLFISTSVALERINLESIIFGTLFLFETAPLAKFKVDLPIFSPTRRTEVLYLFSLWLVFACFDKL